MPARPLLACKVLVAATEPTDRRGVEGKGPPIVLSLKLKNPINSAFNGGFRLPFGRGAQLPTVLKGNSNPV